MIQLENPVTTLPLGTEIVKSMRLDAKAIRGCQRACLDLYESRS
jgi:hypothetical protein